MSISEITDRLFGPIPIKRNARAKQIIFKSTHKGLHIVVPTFYSVDTQYLQNLIKKNRESLTKMLSRTQSRTATSRLFSGKIINIEEGNIHILADDNLEKNCVRSVMKDSTLHIYFSASNDISEPRYEKFVSQFIVRQLRRYYGNILIDMVNEYAHRYSLTVKEIRVGRGSRILGHCSRKGVITISAYVLFYPPHLRQYIVCHELAHLTHFNHSPMFHLLCNQYCDGNEQAWIGECRKYNFPIL